MKVTSVKLDDCSAPVICEAKDFDVRVGNVFIIKTEFGQDIGRILCPAYEVKSTRKFKNRKIAELYRLANQDDFEKMKKLQKNNRKALEVAREKAIKHNLPMKIFLARYMFDEKRLMYYFSAENRIDFRDFVKDLASVFKIRIELRQVSQREEARMTGGIGICGQEQCCVRFLNKSDSISIKMAKEQNISLNTAKISGNCGKLLCCLSYEYETYKDLKKPFPKENTTVKVNVNDIDRNKYIGYSIPSTGELSGVVKGTNVLKRTVYLELEDNNTIEVDVDKIKKPGVLGVIK